MNKEKEEDLRKIRKNFRSLLIFCFISISTTFWIVFQLPYRSPADNAFLRFVFDTDSLLLYATFYILGFSLGTILPTLFLYYPYAREWLKRVKEATTAEEFIQAVNISTTKRQKILAGSLAVILLVPSFSFFFLFHAVLPFSIMAGGLVGLWPLWGHKAWVVQKHAGAFLESST